MKKRTLQQRIAEDLKNPEFKKAFDKSDKEISGKIKRAKCIVEVFSRVTGFFRPVQRWNKGKVSEFHDRKTYEVGGKHVSENRPKNR